MTRVSVPATVVDQSFDHLPVRLDGAARNTFFYPARLIPHQPDNEPLDAFEAWCR